MLPLRVPLSLHWMPSVSQCFTSVSWCFTSISWCFTFGSQCFTCVSLCFTSVPWCFMSVSQYLTIFYDVQWVMQLSALTDYPSGIFLPGTELLQSPFTIPAASSPISAELSPIFAELSPIPAVLRSCRDPWGDRRGRVITDAAMPIVARLTKHHKT